MGDIISISDALTITVFSMVVVFIVLIIISIVISILKVLSGGEVKDISKSSAKDTKKKELEFKETIIDEQNDEELVAVIAAAIAASMGVQMPELNIKSIRRIPQSIPAWGLAGRQEQIYSKL